MSITQLCYYLSRSSGHVYRTIHNGNVPRRRSDLSLCPLSDSHQRKFPLARKPPHYRCKNPRKKAFNHLDPRKYVLARHLAELNGTSAEDSNTLNLIANAIDLNGYVVQDNTLITSHCFLSADRDTCSCSCIGDPSNCTEANPYKLFGTECHSRPDTVLLPDGEEFHKVLCDNGLPRLMTIDSFLHNSYRNIVFVHPVSRLYPSTHHSLSPEDRSIQNQLRLDSPIIDCRNFETIYNTSAAILNDLNTLSQVLCLNQFKMAGVYCIAAWYKSNDLGMYWFADSKVSVMFTSWMGLDRDDSDILLPVTEPGETKEGEEISLDSLSEKPSEEAAHGVVRRRHHSSLAKMVLQQTKKFIKSMAQGKQYIVVHTRIDNSFSGYAQRSDFSQYYQNCLMKIKSQLSKLTMEHPDALVFFFMDFGNDVNIKQNSSATVQLNLVKTILMTSKYEVQHYSAEKYGGRSDTPFVTLVEQEFMCRASYLLTLGGGQIQDRLKKRFLKMHFRKKLLSFEFCDVDPATSISGPKYI